MKSIIENRRFNFITFLILNFLVQSSRAIGLNISGTLFLDRFSSSELPFIYMTSGFLLIILSQWFFKLSKYYSNFKLLIISSALLAIIALCSWIFIDYSPLLSQIIIFLLAIFAEILAFTLTSHLWNFLSEYFDIKSGKKYFLYFNIAGTFGGMISGIGIIFFTGQGIKTEDLLVYWFIVILFILPISLIFKYRTKNELNWFPHRGIRNETKGNIFKNLKSTFNTFFDKPYYLYLALFINFGVLMIYSLEYLSKDVFEHLYPRKEELVSFFASVTAISNAVIIIFQFILFPFIIKRIGVGNSVFIFPFSTGFSTISILFTSLIFPFFLKAVSIVTFFIRSQYKDLFYRLVIDLLVNILSYEDKTRIRLALSGIFKAQSALFASLLILFADYCSNYLFKNGYIDFSEKSVSIGFYGVGSIALLASLFYLLVAWRLRKYYLDTVKDSLDKQSISNINTKKELFQFSQDKDILLFKELVLQSSDNTLSYILNQIKNLPYETHPFLIQEYHKRANPTKLSILKHIASNPQKEDHPFLVEIVSGENKEMATRILAESSVYSMIYDFDEAKEIVNNENHSITTRSQALTTLIQYKLDENREILNDLLNHLKKSDEKAHKEILILTASKLKIKEILWDIYPYINGDKELSEYYISAIEHLEPEDQIIFIEYLYNLFTQLDIRMRKAILKIFSQVPVSIIFTELQKSFNSLSINEQCQILKIGVEQNLLSYDDLKAILEGIDTEEYLFQTACILFYNYKESADYLIKHTSIKEKLIIQLTELIQSAFLVDQLSETPLLKKVLTEYIIKAVKKILTLELILIIESKDFSKITNGLCSNENDEIQKAIEFIDIHCSFTKMNEITQYLVFLEDHEKWKTLVQFKKDFKLNRKSMLQNIFYSSPYYWIKTVTLYEYSTWFKYNWPEEEIRNNLPEDYLIDPFFNEALDNFKYGKSKMLSTFEKILILEKVPFFSNLATDDLKLISNITEEVKFTKDSVIIKAHETGNELYMLYEGEVLVTRGSKKVILEPPAHFGEIAILAGSGKRTATVKAINNCKTLTITSDRFKNLILEFPHIIFPVLQITFQRLALDSTK